MVVNFVKYKDMSFRSQKNKMLNNIFHVVLFNKTEKQNMDIYLRNEISKLYTCNLILN